MNKPHSLQLGPPTPMAGLDQSSFYETTAAANGVAYRVFVGAPIVVEPGRRYPAIYVLDGKLNFAMVHAQVQILSALGQMPPAYVVGVGYAGDESFFAKDGFLRQQDLTPNAGGEFEAAMKTMNGAGAVTHGGAEAFLAFLTRELRPALETAHAIDPDDATLLGNSLGGLFPSWVLFHQPEAFQRYVIVSPSWWWNRYEVWDWEARYAERHHDLKARAFITFGGLETADRHEAIARRALADASGEVKTALERAFAMSSAQGWPQGAELSPIFAGKLAARGYPSLDLAVVNLPEETHESIPGPAFSRGLRFVFGAWRPDGGEAQLDGPQLGGTWWTKEATSPSPDRAPSLPRR